MPESPTRLEAQALALAAALEAAQLVEQLAREGEAPAARVQALLEGLFRFEWQSPAEVFGDATRLAQGLAALEALLVDPAAPAHRTLLRRLLGLLHLGRQLARQRAMLAFIRERLQQLAGEQPRDDAADQLAARIAVIYQESVSTLAWRIRVNGNARHLQDPRVAARIRALLLAGLRAVVLWLHLGGSRTALLLGRRRLLAACRGLRRQAA